MTKSTAIVWFRRDLRLHDLPGLAEAAAEHDHVVPLFVFDDALLRGRFRSANRMNWMLGCLEVLDANLRERGARLITRRGDPAAEVPRLAAEVHARAVYVSDDTTAFARRRDERVDAALRTHTEATLERRPGLYVADLEHVRTNGGGPFTVFSPFARAWTKQPRRATVRTPQRLELPPGITTGPLPTLRELGFPDPPRDLEDPIEPGEQAGAAVVKRFLASRVDRYADHRNQLSWTTSRLSAYLRFGCVSPLALEQRVAQRATGDRSDGPTMFRTELAWRDFYAAVQLHFPETARREFVPRFRHLEWDDDHDLLDAWTSGTTGYPVVDAAMRQLVAVGWMHNRARMVVGSFLTKDLGLDWRLGERFFMEHLLDGDVGSNNGGWQWVASTGTDPAPFQRRLFNPTLQQRKFDADGAYVRRWCPELARVPDAKLAEPWTMTDDEQRAAGCVIGRDYPAPVVDHQEARRRTIERYQAVTGR